MYCKAFIFSKNSVDETISSYLKDVAEKSINIKDIKYNIINLFNYFGYSGNVKGWIESDCIESDGTTIYEYDFEDFKKFGKILYTYVDNIKYEFSNMRNDLLLKYYIYIITNSNYEFNYLEKSKVQDFNNYLLKHDDMSQFFKNPVFV
jgi:hypothetical protein